MTLKEMQLSKSLENKGVTSICLNEDENIITININEHLLNSDLSPEFDTTISNIRKSLDSYLYNIKIKEEILYNISKFLGPIFDTKNEPVDISCLGKDVQSTDTEDNISIEEWQTTLLSKYSDLKNKVMEQMPELWKPLEYSLSVKSILNIQDCTLPFIGIILGPPSSVKTVTIELFRGSGHTFYTDNFSPKSFVSHNTAVARDKLSSVDLLPKIKDRLFLTPELSPTFSKRYDELIEILGIITRIADGHGYESDTGAQGHRGYTGEHMFTWIGAAVDIPQKVHKLLGTLGPKLYFLRLVNKKNISEEKYLEKIKNVDLFRENFNQTKTALNDYLEWFNKYTSTSSNEEDSDIPEAITNQNKPIKIKWDSHKDSDQALLCIVRHAKLLSHFRGVIPTWETRDTQGSDYAYTFATIEEPERAITQLKNLARGHALSQGRNFITIKDIPLIVSVVLSTASRERVKVFEHLLENNGQTDTIKIIEDLRTARPTALRTMTEFVALEIVDKIVLGDDKVRYYKEDEEIDERYIIKPNSLIQIKLKPEFNWFLTDEFKKLLNLSENKTNYEKDILDLQQQNTLDSEDYHIKSNRPQETEGHKENCTPSTDNSIIRKDELIDCKNFPITLHSDNYYYPIVLYSRK